MRKWKQFLALLLTFALLFGICGVAEDFAAVPAQIEETLEPVEEAPIAAPAEEVPVAEAPEEEPVAEEPVEEEVVEEEAPAEELVEEELVEEPEADAEAGESYEADQLAADPCPAGEHEIDYSKPVPVDEFLHGYQCSKCGYIEYTDYHYALCTNPTKCAGCGASFTPNYIEHAHEWDEGNTYTYLNDTYHTWVCPDCKETVKFSHRVDCSQSAPYICQECNHEVKNPDLNHDYDWEHRKSDDKYHWYVCKNCGQELEKYEHYTYCDGTPGICSDCGASYSGGNIEHDYDWTSYQHDQTTHWQVCRRCGAEGEHYEHYASCKNPGVCEECKATTGIAWVSHDYDSYYAGPIVGSDANVHWSKCADCGALNYETHWVDCTDPDGKCECGQPAAEVRHDYDWEVYEHDEWSHWNRCNACGQKLYQSFHMIRCTDENKASATCLECGAEVLAENEPYVVHDDSRPTSLNSKYHVSTCSWCGRTEKEKHYVYCTSGKSKVCVVCGKKCSPKKEHDPSQCYIVPNDKGCGLYCGRCKKYVWKREHYVSCTSDGRCENCYQEVPNATVQHYYVNGQCIFCGSEVQIECPEALTLTAKASATIKPSCPIDAKFTYESLNKSVATVNSKGKISAKAAGKAEIVITGKNSGMKKSCIVTVLPNPTSISLEVISGSSTANIGMDLVQLKASVQPADALQDVTWKVSNGKASVLNGIVTPLKPGKVTISATTKAANKKGKKLTAKFNLLVVDPKLPTSVTIGQTSPQTIYLGGEGLQLTATVEPKETASQAVTWSIPKKQQKYATIDPNTGLVKPGSKAGTVTVTVTTQEKKVNGKRATATIKIKVAAAP